MQSAETKGFSISMGGVSIDISDVLVSAKLTGKTNFSVSFYNEVLKDLDETDKYGIFYTMMELSIGEGLANVYVKEVFESPAASEDMVPLSSLENTIREAVESAGEEVFTNPADVGIAYTMEPDGTRGLRYDVIAGQTTWVGMLNEFYLGDGYRYSKLTEYGANAAFLSFGNSEIPQDLLVERRSEIEDDLNAMMIPKGYGMTIGGATGTDNSYIDLILYDEGAFRKEAKALLKKYPYEFRISDFRHGSKASKL